MRINADGTFTAGQAYLYGEDCKYSTGNGITIDKEGRVWTVGYTGYGL